MSYYIIWQYDVPQENATEFENEYGKKGAWGRFFMQSPFYQGSTLLKPTDKNQHYVIIDRWVDQPAYENFLRDNKDGYNGLSKIYQRLFNSEEKLGQYTD
ncbi:MAG: antibiotic biosynthesis monooxygenase [bacterium]|nr:antibiotic biosynthesis monooxygenase [bacterium]